MFAFYRAKARAPRTGLLQPVLALILAALLGACSSSKQPAGPQVFAWLQPQPPPPVPIDTMAAEIEDDGLPAQTPPSASIGKMPDDPNARWSPNYGRSASGVGDVTTAHTDTADDSWRPVARPAEGAVPDDEGMPLPKSPDEAGIRSEQNPAQKGAYLTLPLGLCIGWKCTP
jgi:hypothetical protein